MRLTGAGERDAGTAGIDARRGNFEAALRRVAERGVARRAAGSQCASELQAKREGVAPGARRWTDGLGAARGSLGEPAGGTPATPAPRREQAPAVASVAPSTLAAAVRAVPPVVEAFQRAGMPAVSLDFGGGLSIELRRGAGGVELVLAAPAALSGAARAELSGLRTALAARGVTLARAEVRQHEPRGGQGR
jgi:hypothetical protein